MTLDTERQEIEGQYKANAIAGLSVGYDGHDFTAEPRSIRITIQSGAASQKSMGSPGSNIARHVGIAFFEVFTEGGKGSTEARGYAETVMGLYRNQNLGGIKCKIPYISGKRDEEPLFVMVVAVPFERDEFNA